MIPPIGRGKRSSAYQVARNHFLGRRPLRSSPVTKCRAAVGHAARKLAGADGFPGARKKCREMRPKWITFLYHNKVSVNFAQKPLSCGRWLQEAGSPWTARRWLP